MILLCHITWCIQLTLLVQKSKLVIHHPTLTTSNKKFLILTSPHKLYQIHTQFTKATLSEFETEFDRTLTYQHKINFLTILNHTFLPKITYPKSQYPLQNLTIYEVLSKWCHYITNLIYTQFQIIHSILILQYPKFPCHIYPKRSNHFLLIAHITLPS